MFLNALDAAAFVLGKKLNVLSMNSQAQWMLKNRRYIAVVDALLRVDETQGELFFGSLNSVLISGESKSLTLVESGSERCAHITITRFLTEESVHMNVVSYLLVLISEPFQKRIASVNQLIELYSFSAAEAKLAFALASGDELDAYANRTGVKIATLRTQLASIYLKARVHRQSDLIRLVLSIPAAFDSSGYTVA
jgi:DNA-binding CsgD family transcriptional regulator